MDQQTYRMLLSGTGDEKTASVFETLAYGLGNSGAHNTNLTRLVRYLLQLGVESHAILYLASMANGNTKEPMSEAEFLRTFESILERYLSNKKEVPAIETEQSILEAEEREIVAFDSNNATTIEKREFNKMKFLHYKPFWWRKLQLKWNKDYTVGTIMNTVLENVVVILENDEATIDSFAFDEFTREHILKHDVDILGDVFEAGYIPNAIVPTIRSYIDKNYHAHFAKQTIADAIDLVGYYNKFNPVADYMKSAHEKWINAGKPEVLDNFFVNSLGAEKSELTALQTRIFFAEMVTKGTHPEKSADFVLDLVGRKGVGKTRTLRRLGLNWYVDVPNFHDKKQIIKMCSALLVNDDEMKAMKASGLAVTKSFITNTEITYRMPYHAKSKTVTKNCVKSKTVTKNCVISQTTDNEEHLNDITGNWRFMPMMCLKGNKTKDISEYSDDEIAILFGEAFELVENGFDYNHLTAEQSIMLEDSRKKFTFVSDEESAIDMYLSTVDSDFITTGEMMEKIFGIKDGESGSRELQLKIHSVMSSKRNDWRKTRRRINGERYRGWERVNK